MSTKHNSEEMRLVKIDSPFMISAHLISLRKKKHVTVDTIALRVLFKFIGKFSPIS